MEMIIERYKLKDIHEIWPNLTLYCHVGVAFEPYKKGFERLLGKPISYIETYLASEGFIAYQDRQDPDGMKLVLNEHIFFEFIPFDDEHFDTDGNITDASKTILIEDVEEQINYAILISTAAGAWRYLIGDTIRFVNKERSEIIITGRTKHFLSIVGEHLSVDNMNKAIHLVSEEFNLSIPEYGVRGENVDSLFGHHWYVACDQSVDGVALAKAIDEKLIVLNDDYAIERKSALKRIRVTVLKENVFMDFMQAKGKIGGQHKFPRVLKGDLLKDWEIFIQNK
jgi:hypothetical protein